MVILTTNENVQSPKDITDVAIIGSGNVATHIGRAIAASGADIVGLWSPNAGHAQSLAENLHCPAFDSLEHLPLASLCVIAVKDDVLPAVAQKVCQLYSSSAESIIAHTAGSVSLEVLSFWHERAAVIYPLQTLSRQRPIDFKEVPLFVEGSTRQVFSAVLNFCSRLSGHVMEANSFQRARIHLAAVFASNFSNHCCAIAQRLLGECGLDDKCILPLVEETARKLRTLPASEAQTGPAARWDTSILNAHIEQLDAHPLWQSIYKEMSQSIHENNSPT